MRCGSSCHNANARDVNEMDRGGARIKAGIAARGEKQESGGCKNKHQKDGVRSLTFVLVPLFNRSSRGFGLFSFVAVWYLNWR